jgi:uncharacterized membrane protein
MADEMDMSGVGNDAILQALQQPLTLQELDYAQVWAHPHNQWVHFPIALGLTGVVLVLLARRWPSLYTSAAVCLTMGALGGVTASITGWLQRESFTTGPWSYVLQVHQTFGFLASAYLVLCAFVSWRPAFRPWLWLYVLPLAVGLFVAALYGGFLSSSSSL